MGISTWTWGFSFSFKKKNENKARVEIPKRAIYWSLSFLATQENARWGEQSQITSLPTLCFLYHMLRRIQFTCWSFASSQCEKTYCDISSLVTEPMFFFFFWSGGGGKNEEAGNTTILPARIFLKAWRALNIVFSSAYGLAWAHLGTSRGDVHWLPERRGRRDLERPPVRTCYIGVQSIFFFKLPFYVQGQPSLLLHQRWDVWVQSTDLGYDIPPRPLGTHLVLHDWCIRGWQILVK